jgi:hypothetical protein
MAQRHQVKRKTEHSNCCACLRVQCSKYKQVLISNSSQRILFLQNFKVVRFYDYSSYGMARETNVVCLPPAFTLVSCSAYSSTLKMEVICSSETSVDFQQTTRHYIPEDRTLQVPFCTTCTSQKLFTISVDY